MRKIIFTSLVMLFSISVFAEESAMIFTTTDNVTRKIDSKGLEITFTDGNLIATNSTESIILPLAQMSAMQFEGINSSVITFGDMNSSLTVTNVGGIVLGTFDSIADANSQLPAGTYVAKFDNGKSFKFIVKR